ncbi:pollen-specific leucine-rich repeat extensin-like protein 3 [Sitophilus oryzae]|uniref:Pollen-specific leucine-rich repeat extensin-like protein 3 n=1 Tax=Sitophilus oryzae TaxID=7048 RepID=A0A6J2YFF2_SITOR|nr:pollen-specific leucine-rich repeat extensin-like protein 3 [Sitophilus oryzae]
MLRKTITLVLVAYLNVSLAEPQRWQSNSRISRFQRLQAPPPQSAAPAQPPVPQTVYGPPSPAPSYGPPPPPSASYGPPSQDPSLTTTGAATTTELPATTEPNSESVNATSASGRLREKPDTGVYYIYHPSGLLQKVRYETKDDVRNKAFNARLKYENVEPIAGPIYTYDPQSYVFQRIKKR